MAKTVRDPVEGPSGRESKAAAKIDPFNRASPKGKGVAKTPEQEAADRRRARAGFVTSIAVTAVAIGALIWRLGS